MLWAKYFIRLLKLNFLFWIFEMEYWPIGFVLHRNINCKQKILKKQPNLFNFIREASVSTQMWWIGEWCQKTEFDYQFWMYFVWHTIFLNFCKLFCANHVLYCMKAHVVHCIFLFNFIEKKLSHAKIYICEYISLLFNPFYGYFPVRDTHYMW